MRDAAPRGHINAWMLGARGRVRRTSARRAAAAAERCKELLVLRLVRLDGGAVDARDIAGVLLRRRGLHRARQLVDALFLLVPCDDRQLILLYLQPPQHRYPPGPKLSTEQFVRAPAIASTRGWRACAARW